VITVSGCSESGCSSGFLYFVPLLSTFVGDAIDFDVFWERALEGNALIIVSSLLSAFPLSACICCMAVNFAIGALTFMAVSSSTASTVSTVSTASSVSSASSASSASTTPMASALATVAAALSEKGGPCGCISKCFVEAGCSFFF